MTSKVAPFWRRHGIKGATALIAAVAFVIRCLLSRRLKPQGVTLMPSHWLLGNIQQLIELLRAVSQNRHLEHSLKNHRELGQTFATKPPFSPWWILTSDPRNVEHVLSTQFENYPKGEWVVNKMADALGRGFFNADGLEWYHQRKTASRMFTEQLFKDHVWTVVQRNAKKLRDSLQSAADGQYTIDVYGMLRRFSLDTIGEIGFGKCIGSLENPSLPFSQAFDEAGLIIFKRFVTPFWQILKILRLGYEKSTSKHMGTVDVYLGNVVRELRDRIAKEDNGSRSSGVTWADMEARKSFVGLFVSEAERRGETLTDRHVRDLMANFLVAGRNNAANAMSWTLFCLCTHQDVATKVRKEIKNVCGAQGFAYEDLKRLNYLQAVINEALRLYPAVPVNAKVAAQDDELPDGTQVPKGTVVMYSCYVMARDASIWGSDAEIFRPERWLEMHDPPDNYRYPVFHGGPRECLGRQLAMVEMKTCLVTLLRQLSFTLAVPESQIAHDGTLTFGMAHGLPCLVTRVEERAESPKSSQPVTSKAKAKEPPKSRSLGTGPSVPSPPVTRRPEDPKTYHMRGPSDFDDRGADTSEAESEAKSEGSKMSWADLSEADSDCINEKTAPLSLPEGMSELPKMAAAAAAGETADRQRRQRSGRSRQREKRRQQKKDEEQ